MITKVQEIAGPSGEYALWSIVPETQHIELRVTTTAQQASITPSSGKKIRVHSLFVSTTIKTTLTSTLRASISFGTGGVGTASKVLWSSRLITATDFAETFLGDLNVVGAVDETVTLTNITFSAGTISIRAVVYYTEE